MRHHWEFARVMAVLCFICASRAAYCAQQPTGSTSTKPAEKTSSTDKTPDKATIPFQIQLLDTHIRFETNGDSRKEVHTIVKLNNAMGAQQFSRLGFDYNRAFQQVEIPLVRVTHANGGTSEVLSSAITDVPNPVVDKYPAYHDVRVKSVRILGLQEGDTIEYRVVTTTARHPLAPDFWLDHSFDRSGQVLEEYYELDLPTAREVKVWTSKESLAFDRQESDQDGEARVCYSWKLPASSASPRNTENLNDHKTEVPQYLSESDVAVTTYRDWPSFMVAVQKFFRGIAAPVSEEIKGKSAELTHTASTGEERLRRLYEFVAQGIVTIDLPPTSQGFATHAPEQILASGYATPEDKSVLLVSLASAAAIKTSPAFTGLPVQSIKRGPVLPSAFTNVLVFAPDLKKGLWLDPAQPVAPFGMVAASLRGKPALLPYPLCDICFFENVANSLPFDASQKVGVNAAVGEDGKLNAKVKYTLRGDNELLLRVAFHQTVKEKWKDVAGLLALSDGFRGVIASANASDPMATKEPFTVEYELTQDKFVDWSKKPVRIPALLPQIGLPDASGKNSAGNIELGTPLDVETQVTLRLPEGTTAQAPAGTSLQRDYATYSSKYGFTGNTLTAQRHIHFLKREVSGDRTLDYSAFVQAVQNDQAQYFVLDRGAGVKSAGLK